MAVHFAATKLLVAPTGSAAYAIRFWNAACCWLWPAAAKTTASKHIVRRGFAEIKIVSMVWTTTYISMDQLRAALRQGSQPCCTK